MQQIGLRDMETTDEMDIVKFKSWVKENTYFIEVTDGTDRSLRFITKNQVRPVCEPLRLVLILITI